MPYQFSAAEKYRTLGFYGNADYSVSAGGYNAEINIFMTNDNEKIGIGKSDVKVEDGKVNITTDIGTRPSMMMASDYIECQTDVPLEEIYIDGRLVWKDGVEITPITYDIYNAKRDEVGECIKPGNSTLTKIAGLTDDLDDRGFAMTTVFAVGNRIKYEENYGFDDNTHESREQEYRLISYILLGVIGKLEAVDFTLYGEDGEDRSFTVNKEEADKFYGGDIKKLGKDIVALQHFINDEIIGKAMSFLGLYYEYYYAEQVLGSGILEETFVVCPTVETPTIKTVKVRCFYEEDLYVSSQSTFLVENFLSSHSSFYGNMYLDPDDA